jgi:hypothetical protein
MSILITEKAEKESCKPVPLIPRLLEMGVKISNWWRTWSWLVVPEEKEEKEEEKETDTEGEEREKKTAATGMFSLFDYLKG